MNRSKVFLFLSIICITEVFLAIFSFVLQWNINQFEKSINANKEELARTDVEIKILKTQISHLTSIPRIKEVSNKYLPNYKNITSDDFIRSIGIPVKQFE